MKLLTFILFLVLVCSVSALDLSQSQLTSDTKIEVKTDKLSMEKLDSKSMKFDSTVCTYKSGNLMQLQTDGAKIKFGFTEPDVITCTNILKCEGHKTWTSEDKWLYWNPVWILTGYNSGIDEEGKVFMTPSFSNAVSVSCTCKQEETRYIEECTPAVYDEKEPEKVKIPESCKTVSYKVCVLYDATVKTPTSYDPVYEANSAPVITAISQSTPTGLFYDYENITGSITVVDSDTTDQIFNYSMFSEASGKNTSLYMPGEQPFPTDVSGNGLTLTTSGFTAYNGVLGNATVADAAEPTIVQGKYGRGMGFDGEDDYISNNFNPSNGTFTICTWLNIYSNVSGNRARIYDNTNTIFYIDTNSENNRMKYTISNNAGGTSVLYNISPEYNVSNYVCFIRYSDTSGSLFINGKFIKNAGIGNLYDSPGFYIGNRLELDRAFNGTFDNYQIHLCALSSSNINASMSSPYPLGIANGFPCDPVLSYGFDGTVANGVVNDTNYLVSDGHGGGAYKLDGINDYITTNYYVNVSKNYSLRIRFKANSLNANTKGLIVHRTGNNVFSTSITSSAIVGSFYNTSGVVGLTLSQIGNKDWTGIPIDLTFTKNNSEYKLFINGIINNTGNMINPNDPGFSTLSLGEIILNANRFFNGTIYNSQIFNYPLTPSQILLDYQAWANNLTSNVLSSDMTTTGDTWQYCSRSSDYSSTSDYNCTAGETIINSDYAPTTTAIQIQPATAYTNTDLQCNVTAWDTENTTFRIDYYWYEGNNLLSSGSYSNYQNNTPTIVSTLSSALFSENQTINCTVRPYDGLNYGIYNRTSVEVLNSIPTVPTLVSHANASVTGLTTRTLNYSCSDADGESIYYAIYGSNDISAMVLMQNTTSSQYNWTGLSATNTYYTYAICYDSTVASSASGTYNFYVSSVYMTQWEETQFDEFTTAIIKSGGKMWYIAAAIMFIGILGIFIYIGKTWDFNIADNKETNSKQNTGDMDKRQRINVMRLFITWGLFLINPLLVSIVSEMAAAESASNDLLTLIDTSYNVIMTIAYVVSAYFMLYLFINLLQFFGVDAFKTFRRTSR